MTLFHAATGRAGENPSHASAIDGAGFGRDHGFRPKETGAHPMNIRTFLSSIALATAALSGAAPALAVPVDHHGAIFDFSITQVAGARYSVVYTADFTDFDPGKNDYIVAINWKVSGAQPLSVSLVSTNAAGSWGSPLINNNVDAKGCKVESKGNNAFVCLKADDWLSQATSGSLEWIFDVVFDAPLTESQLANVGNPIRALFAQQDGQGAKKAGLMSCTTGGGEAECDPVTLVSLPPVEQISPPPVSELPPVAQVPEPGVAGLLGLGALGLLAARRRTARTGRDASGG